MLYWILWAIVAVGLIVGLDRLLLWTESKGWVNTDPEGIGDR